VVKDERDRLSRKLIDANKEFEIQLEKVGRESNEQWEQAYEKIVDSLDGRICAKVDAAWESFKKSAQFQQEFKKGFDYANQLVRVNNPRVAHVFDAAQDASSKDAC
jgi:hypothetical protein